MTGSAVLEIILEKKFEIIKQRLNANDKVDKLILDNEIDLLTDLFEEIVKLIEKEQVNG